MIRDYFSEVEKKLEEIKWLIKKKTVEFNLVSEEMGIVKGKIVFVNNSALDFRELVSEEHTDYRFHFMNGNNRLIKRWDKIDNMPVILRIDVDRAYMKHPPDYLRTFYGILPAIDSLGYLEHCKKNGG